MKKRNTEGFALAYVVIVIFILCALSIALMSMTLRTLQAQEASVKRMQDKYAAQGEIERLVAELEYECEHTLSGSDYGSKSAAETAAANALSECVNSFASANGWSTSSNMVIAKSTSESNLVTVNAKLTFELTEVKYTSTSNEDAYNDWHDNPAPGVPEPPKDFHHYKIIDVTFTFTSYEITTEGGDLE